MAAVVVLFLIAVIVWLAAAVLLTKQAPGKDKVAKVVTNLGPTPTSTPSTVAAADANTPASTARCSVNATSQAAAGLKVIAAE